MTLQRGTAQSARFSINMHLRALLCLCHWPCLLPCVAILGGCQSKSMQVSTQWYSLLPKFCFMVKNGQHTTTNCPWLTRCSTIVFVSSRPWITRTLTIDNSCIHIFSDSVLRIRRRVPIVLAMDPLSPHVPYQICKFRPFG